MQSPRFFHIVSLGTFFALLLLVAAPFRSYGQTAEELQVKISGKNQEIAELEKEIAQFQTELNAVGKQATTLQGALNALELTRKKLTADITLTQKKIDTVTLEIQSLGGQIEDKESRIGSLHNALGKSIRDVADLDETSLLEALLSYDSLGDFWGGQVVREELHGAMSEKVEELQAIKTDLTNTKDKTEKKRRELQDLKLQLSDQRKIVEANKAETNKLLRETKNVEANYKKILADRQAKRDAFEQELKSYESQLRLIIDPGSFPKPSSGVLRWPVDNPFVTQQFGDTEFSRRNPQAYSGSGHNGIDLRASPGTPIKAALSGVVSGVGDTDTVCPGASYGKWVLIKHSNGLSTLYAHLSLVRVGQGQNVGTGEIIGYSGSTGYATGPHLHFTVYATEGLQIVSRKSRICSGTYTLPVADLKAYLNPMLYL